jgi:Na+/H+ antiporter NhaD/arsenite permease-like protein
MPESIQGTNSNRPFLLTIGLVLFLYLVLAVLGVPQAWTAQIQAGTSHDAVEDAASGPVPISDSHKKMAESTVSESETLVRPPLWTVFPFLLLISAVAICPLLRVTEIWWESNRNRLIVVLVLATLTLAYYVFFHSHPVEGHWPTHKLVSPTAGANWALARTVFENAILGEYVPFIILMFSLYVITGGIRIEGDLNPRPSTNVALLTIGGLLAGFIGTTGAAMLLIRPLLEANRGRKRVVHTVVFFIFVVCNCGGLLLPIGDPPLFLGYLRGVPFLWTLTLWRPWLFVNGVLLAVYFLWDRYYAYPLEKLGESGRKKGRLKSANVERRRAKSSETSVSASIRVLGLWPNALLLLGVVLSIALLTPERSFPGTDWHPWVFLREAVQLGLVACSLGMSRREVRSANRFNYLAMAEVAILFFGIFICMQAPLQILTEEGSSLGVRSPSAFFWATGLLSALLDNAPTYVVFFTMAGTLDTPEGTVIVAGVAESLLIGISLGAVFIGAMTYIGNGPNFMVKSIAEQSGVEMPSFFGFMLYSCTILLPILLVATWLFL